MMQAFRLDIGNRWYLIVFLCALLVGLFQFEICRAGTSVTCGKDYNNAICEGKNECCSNYGYCGITTEYCGSGCQSGSCISGTPPLLPGACGAIGNQTVDCPNNFCCSANGYCGITNAYCGDGCQGGPCLFPKSKALSAGAYAGIAVGIVAASLIFVLVFLFVCHRRRRRLEAVKSVEDGHQLSVEPGLFSQNSKLSFGGVKLSFETLETATTGFSTELGRGAFGVVYKGTMKDDTRVAVKRLVNNERGLKDFEAEVKTLGSINHGNLVALLGYCFERNQPFLIYEYVANGSLDKWIFANKDREDPNFVLPWKTRVDIAKGTAKGLAYLHEDLQIGQAIIHLDVKPENILLNEFFVPKVADFGMAKLLGSKKTQTLASGGTIGYMAPEVYIGAATSKMDVYSFGIVLLETMSGRRHLDHSKPKDEVYLPSWAVRKVAQGEELDVIDQLLEEEDFDAKEAKRLILVALLCLQRDPDHRPEMGSVLRMMDGITIPPQLPPPGLQSELEMTERLIRRGMASDKDDKDNSCFIDFSSICEEEGQPVSAGPHGKHSISSQASQRPLLFQSTMSLRSSLRRRPCDPISESPNAEIPEERPPETQP